MGLWEPTQLEVIKTQPRRQQTGNSLGSQSCRKKPLPQKCLAAPLLYFDSVSDMAWRSAQ